MGVDDKYCVSTSENINISFHSNIKIRKKMNATITNSTVTISQFPLFDCLNDDEKRRLEDMSEFKIKPKFSHIYLPDETSEHIYFLAKGMIKIATHSDEGKEVIKTIIQPLAMFGELGIIGETKRQDMAQALREEVHLFSLRIDDLKKLMRSNFVTLRQGHENSLETASCELRTNWNH